MLLKSNLRLSNFVVNVDERGVEESLDGLATFVGALLNHAVPDATLS